jgi:flagellar motility protein MotE (MotC chaperone)
MSRMPRILPLAGVAVVGVLAINVASGAKTIPSMFTGAKAWAEGVAGAPAVPPPVAAKPAAVCAPTAAELAKEAGLSPAELQILQSLGVRRGELDQQAQSIDTNQQLLAAAAAKLDERVKALSTLKTDIQALLVQSDAQQKAENLRLVTVYSAMKPKDAALRMSLLDDGVLVPIAAGMKERTLAGIIAKMDGPVAKKLTENLARRFAAAQVIKDGQAAVAAPPLAQTALAATPAKPLAGGPALAGAKASLAPPPPTAPAAKAPTTDVPAATPTPPKAKPRPVAKKPVARKPAAKPAAKPTTVASAPTTGPMPYKRPDKSPEKPGDKPTPATTAAAGDTTKTPATPVPAK